MSTSILSSPFKSVGTLSALALQKGIKNLEECMQYLKKIPYGRNSARDDFSLVFKEGCGTCSSKHAVLKSIAIEQEIESVQMVLCIYKMTEKNTPNIGEHISKAGLDYIPEAHCYLQIGTTKHDLTSPNANMETIADEILYEEQILPHQVDEYKVASHKTFLKSWLHEEKINLSFNELWTLREKCIESLSKNKV